MKSGFKYTFLLLLMLLSDEFLGVAIFNTGSADDTYNFNGPQFFWDHMCTYKDMCRAYLDIFLRNYTEAIGSFHHSKPRILLPVSIDTLGMWVGELLMYSALLWVLSHRYF